MFRSFRSARLSTVSSSSNHFQAAGSNNEAMTTMSGNSTQPSQPLAVVELFQSQGCNSCPPSNANLLNLTNSSCPPQNPLATLPSDQDSNILLLTFHVTYWDYLGWSDTFADRAFDNRQRDYVRRMGLRSAFTPQVVVNGRSSGVGSSKGDLARVLREGEAGHVLPAAVSIVREEGSGNATVSVNSSNLADGIDLDVMVAWYDPSIVDVKIGRGENRGRTLPHQNVVRSVQRLGDVRAGDEQVFVIERRKDGLEGVVLVQEGPGGRIMGAARI
jgi:hypothetical protein